ncbi:MAG: class I SAM-dependent methyltransferase [Terriglobia bacterium]
MGTQTEELKGVQALPLRLEPSPQFAFLRDFLRSSDFYEPPICRRAGLTGLDEFLAGDRVRGILSDQSDGLGVLIRLLLLGESLEVKVLETAIPAGVVEAMKELGLLIQDPTDFAPPLTPLPNRGGESGEGVALLRRREGESPMGAPAKMCASVALYPVGELFIASDRWTVAQGNAGELWGDFVFPAITPNTSQFVATLPQEPCESCLDLCSGTGVAALDAARRGSHASWAVDITERSTQMAEFNRLLNGFNNVTVMQGDLYEPLGDLTFERIVAHPPYMPVLSRAQVFYDGGADGEQVTRRIVMELPRHLRPGGRFYCLAQGSDREDAPLEQRVRAWLGEAQSEFDLLVIVRQDQAPLNTALQYAVKAKGGGRAAQQMRDALKGLGVQNMVYGWLIIQRRDEARPVFTVRRSVGRILSRREVAWLLKWETAAVNPAFIDGLADAHPVATPSLELHTVHRMKDGELQPEQFELHTEYPFNVECRVQPWVGFLLPQCDGTSTVRQLHEFCRQNKFIDPETPLAEFTKLLAVFISGGFLEVEEFRLPESLAGR